MREPKDVSRRNRVRALIVAGFTVDQIKETCSFSTTEINDLIEQAIKSLKDEKLKENTVFNRHLNITNGVGFGSKTECYFSPSDYSEEDLINWQPNYEYSELSDDEKTIYSKNLIDIEKITPMQRIIKIDNYIAIIPSNKPACKKGGEHSWNGDEILSFDDLGNELKKSEFDTLPDKMKHILSVVSGKSSCSKCGIEYTSYDNPNFL